MHFFILYYFKNNVYHMEHPNFKKKGIFEYDSEESATCDIVNYYKKLRDGKEIKVTEFFKVNSGLSFKEFNKYINHIGE